MARRHQDVSVAAAWRASQWHSDRISSTSRAVPPAQPRRRAGTQGQHALRAAGLERTGLPAGIALRLSRQVRQRDADGRKAAAQRPGIDRVVLLRSHRLRGRLMDEAEQGNPGIESHIDEADAGVAPGDSVGSAMGLRRVPVRVEELKGDVAPSGSGGDDATTRDRTRGLRRHHDPACRHHDEPPHRRLRRAQHGKHRPVDRPRHPRNRARPAKSDHGAEGHHDAKQRLAVAFDGEGPVHPAHIE